jgi:SAM-dependent methyltransferase
MIGELYEQALAGLMWPELEFPDGASSPLDAQRWRQLLPGDAALLDRCTGPALDVGAGPGRLTVGLAERGVPALAIDVTPYAVVLARSSGALALQRDVFGHLPGAGRWATVLLADGNIGIGGDPVALLHRVATLLKPGGAIIIELGPPGAPTRCERVRLHTPARSGSWFPWAWVGIDQIGLLTEPLGLAVSETWTDAGRWFAVLTSSGPAGRS